jgi:hypothetical protein
MKHWYVVKESYSDSLKVGDVIGFSRQNPNLTKLVDGHFTPSATWIYIGRWETPPIEDLIEATKLIETKGEVK